MFRKMYILINKLLHLVTDKMSTLLCYANFRFLKILLKCICYLLELKD